VITSDDPAAGPRPYSTRLRTALVLTGTGTAGAYHAGILRAIYEAGVRVDLVAARGIGAIGATFAAVDGAQRLWDRDGFWKGDAIAKAYRWRRPLQITGWALAAAVVLLAIPIAVSAVGVFAALLGLLLSLLTLTSASQAVTSGYRSAVDALLEPTALPTIIPRLVVFCLLVAVIVLVVSLALSLWTAPARRRVRQGTFWRLFGSPLSATFVLDRAATSLWSLIRGAAALAPPSRVDLGRRYLELLSENLGQPGFRELLLVAHDVDAHRDLLFALLGPAHRQRFFARDAEGGRAAEAFDLAGVARDHLMDAVAACVAIPVATDPHVLRFPVDGTWRGEAHRACDRPGALERLLDEVAAAGAEQVILISAAPVPGRPHELSAARADLRGRAAEQLASFETAALRDATEHVAGKFRGCYVIRPPHNPVGPLDFAGVYDERSDRYFSLGELVDRGYEDAYHQFIEPVVAASGERIVTVQS
jgi:hypothetical protein